MENIKITPEYTLRTFTLEDAEATVALFNACSIARIGTKESDLQDNLNEWTAPGFDLGSCARVLVAPAGEIVGYVDLWDIDAPHVVKYCYFELHPKHWDDQLALWMLEWAEEIARNRINLTPEGTQVVLSEGTNHADLDHQRVFTAAGFQVVRNFYRMVIDLPQHPTTPILPEGIVIKPINRETQFRDAIMADIEAFKDHWGVVEKTEQDILSFWSHRLDNDPDFDPSLWFLAMDGAQIAGICMCWPKLTEDSGMGWVGQLAVRRPWRKMGLGLALLQHAFCEFSKRGQPRVGLNVDANSLTDATRLYTKAGMHVARQLDIYHKELRSGVNLATEAINT
jgi:mycothiol synthase